MTLEEDDFDWWDGYDDEREPQPVTCKRCGQRDLFWQEVAGRYLLFEDRPNGSIAQHRCKKQKLTNHFEDIP